jgi:hypothetical protein
MIQRIYLFLLKAAWPLWAMGFAILSLIERYHKQYMIAAAWLLYGSLPLLMHIASRGCRLTKEGHSGQSASDSLKGSNNAR